MDKYIPTADPLLILLLTIAFGWVIKVLLSVAKQQLSEFKSFMTIAKAEMDSIKARIAHRERSDDLLERRLKSGQDAMEKIRNMVLDLASRYVERDRFDVWRETHEKNHLTIIEDIDDLKRAQIEANTQIVTATDMLMKSFDELRTVVKKHVDVG
jgi:septum formation topological specificity factor MinE